jgi:hypothetical protein
MCGQPSDNIRSGSRGAPKGLEWLGSEMCASSFLNSEADPPPSSSARTGFQVGGERELARKWGRGGTHLGEAVGLKEFESSA